VFVKWAYSEDSAEWLRKEHRLYSELAAPYMPRLLGWDDDGEHPLLALEALVDVHWPPPWSAEDVAAVREALTRVAATPPPGGLPRVEELIDSVGDWERVRDDPGPFLSTGLVSREWFDASWETLHAAAARAPVEGDVLIHLDVRSDNLCIDGGRARLFDWNWACRGNPDADLACWAPSLLLEDGPSLWELIPRAGEWASWLAGVWAARAGLPTPEGAHPSLREAQRRQLAVVLDVAVRELGLAPTLPE
jgi:Phosphotransferase enzyme family